MRWVSDRVFHPPGTVPISLDGLWDAVPNFFLQIPIALVDHVYVSQRQPPKHIVPGAFFTLGVVEKLQYLIKCSCGFYFSSSSFAHHAERIISINLVTILRNRYLQVSFSFIILAPGIVGYPPMQLIVS